MGGLFFQYKYDFHLLATIILATIIVVVAACACWSIFGSPTRSVAKLIVSAVGPHDTLVAALPGTLGPLPPTLITGRPLLVPCTTSKRREFSVPVEARVG